MSTVSIVEDLTKRLDAIRHELDGKASKVASSPSGKLIEAGLYRHQAANILARIEKLLADIHPLLDLATDPSVDLAQQLSELRRDYERLDTEKREMKAELTRARNHLQVQNASLHVKLQQEIALRKHAEHELVRLERQLGTDPQTFQSFLDRNITDERIDEAKPGEGQRGRRRK